MRLGRARLEVFVEYVGAAELDYSLIQLIVVPFQFRGVGRRTCNLKACRGRASSLVMTTFLSQCGLKFMSCCTIPPSNLLLCHQV